MKEVSEIPIGAFRIGKDLKIYENSKNGWKKSEVKFDSAINVIKLFKINGKFNELIDNKDKNFLKGYLYKNEIKGARINILPDGDKLDKAYSLFSPELHIHDEKSHDHWDLMYKNPNGEYAYVYTLKKDKKSSNEKYAKVNEFEKIYPKLLKNVDNGLKNKDNIALPLMTLLKTYIRVGNEIYYKSHKHKGLTTLMKKDVKIKKDNVTFHYLGKDGVPIDITKEFPNEYVKQLKNNLNEIDNNDFIFKNENGNLLKESDFKAAFKKYCGEEFYPHIVRSYIATEKAKEILVDDFVREFSEDDDVTAQRVEARETLCVKPDEMDIEVINKNYKLLAKKYHPDMPEGDHECFQRINAAHKLLKKELS